MKIKAWFLLSLFVFGGCAGLRGKGKVNYLAPDFKAPDLVGVLPADNQSVDMRAPDTVRKAVISMLIYLGYLPVYSPAQEKSLRKIGLTDGGQLKAFTAAQLHNVLRTDGLLYTNIETFKETNVGVYQNREVKINLALKDSQGEKLWDVEGRATNRAYNLSLKAATDAFVDKLATGLVEKILNIHMLEEASVAAISAGNKIPEWPEGSGKSK